MSAILKALAWVAPGAAMNRLRALHAIESTAERYEGATAGRRGSSFRAVGASANNMIGGKLGALRERSHEMARDHWAFKRILDVSVAHIVGAGISILPDTGNDALNKRVKKSFDKWAKKADVTGEGDLNGLIALGVRSMLEGGNAVYRFVPRKNDGKREVPLALQLLEGEHIDHNRDGLVEGKRVKLGVALEEFDERVGYYLYKQHPHESGGAAVMRQSLQSEFFERRDIIHLYQPTRPGQVLGVPIFAPVLLPARDLADLMDAVVVKSKIEACFAGFVKKTGERSPFSAHSRKENGQRITEFRPGMLYELREGEDVSFANPPSSGGFEPIYNAMLYAMAAGAGITHDQLTGDLRQANYSSLRAGKIEFRRLIEQMQWLTLVPKVLDRIMERWVETAIMAGVLKDRKEGYQFNYVMPANEPIDPKKDLEADILAVRSGRMSPQEFISGYGHPWEQVVEDFGSFLKAIDNAGVVLDIDPRKTNQLGNEQGGYATDEPNRPPAKTAQAA